MLHVGRYLLIEETCVSTFPESWCSLRNATHTDNLKLLKLQTLTAEFFIVQDLERGVLKVQEDLHSETESGTASMGPTVSQMMQHKTPLAPGSSASMQRLLRPPRSNWNQVATFIDRVAFFVYIIIMTVIGVRYLVL